MIAVVVMVGAINGSNPCKIKMEFLKDGTKVRVSKRTGTVIPKPASLKESRFKNNRGLFSFPSSH